MTWGEKTGVVSSSDAIKVMIVDDHTIVREGLKDVLERAGDFDVVGEGADGAEAVEVAAAVRPDVIVMDIMMPGMDGIDACHEIREANPHIRVMMLTASTNEDAVMRSVAAGATGFLSKFCSREKFIETLRDVAEGEFRVPAEAMLRAFATVRTRFPQADASDLGTLTAREREILALYAQGMTYTEIAQAKGNRPLTVRNSIYAIQNKLKVKTKQELVVRAVRSGLLDL